MNRYRQRGPTGDREGRFPRRMNQAKLGVVIVIGFVVLLGGLLFMYVSENRSLHKSIDSLSEALEDSKQKQSNMESDNSACFKKRDELILFSDENEAKLDGCSKELETSARKIQDLTKRLQESAEDLKTKEGEISSLKVVQGNLQTNLADTTKKLQAAKEAQDKAADQAKEEVNSCMEKLHTCEEESKAKSKEDDNGDGDGDGDGGVHGDGGEDKNTTDTKVVK